MSMLLSSLRKSENILKFCKNLIFVISLGRVVVPSHKMLINLPGTYEKGEPDRFSGKRDPSVQTDRQTKKQTNKQRNRQTVKQTN